MTPEARQAFERLPERIRRCIRPSLRIWTSPTSASTLKSGQNRIGGVPDLPQGFQWPRYDGLGLSFIAQFTLKDLAAQPSVLPLPERGSLVFFYDSEQRTWGYDPKDRGSAVVAYFPESSLLVRDPIPDDVPEAGRFQCCALRFTQNQNLPNFESRYYDPQLSEDEQTLLLNYDDAVCDQSD